MAKSNHIPYISSITDFFKIYGLGTPMHPDIMCMRLEDQPDGKLVHMPLYRSGFYRILHLTSSNLFYLTENAQKKARENCLIFSYPGKLESWKREGKLYGTVLYFSKSFLPLDILQPNFDQDYPFFAEKTESIILLTKTEASILLPLQLEMMAEIQSSLPDKLGLIRKILNVYLHKIKRIVETQDELQPTRIKNNRILFNRFRKSVEDHFLLLSSGHAKEMLSVTLMAKKLSIHPNYLNSEIKACSGQTASSFIQAKIILEAKSYLYHSSLQVKEIAYKLGFVHLSYFNQFFKKHVLQTPLQYRTKVTQ